MSKNLKLFDSADSLFVKFPETHLLDLLLIVKYAGTQIHSCFTIILQFMLRTLGIAQCGFPLPLSKNSLIGKTEDIFNVFWIICIDPLKFSGGCNLLCSSVL